MHSQIGWNADMGIDQNGFKVEFFDFQVHEHITIAMGLIGGMIIIGLTNPDGGSIVVIVIVIVVIS
jgi:hypothetical protein